MPYLFSIEQLIAATGGRAENIHAETISSVSIDSRSVKEGALYVAIKGDRFDGHGFVHKSVVNGAVVALVAKDKSRDLAGLPLIIVDDPLTSLGDIARAARARSTAKIIAVTGSAGKTTTKSMLQGVLQRAGATHASIKSYNNHWGVPLMLANMPPSAEFGVFEIGMNHSGEISPLSKLVRPHVAVVTNVGTAHIGNFNNMAEIAAAKAEILDGIEPGGVAIVNMDHPHFDVFKRKAESRSDVELMSYGFSKSADVGIYDYRARENGARAQARFGAVNVNLDLSIPGEHMISNGVGVMCAAEAVGVGFETIVEGLAEFSASAGRGQIIELGGSQRPLIVIDESYNANPDSMKVALAQFASRSANGGKKILVLGDMLELGSRSKGLHADLIEEIAATGVEQLVLVGEKMQALGGELSRDIDVCGVGDVNEIGEAFVNNLAVGDLIMVKGSNGIGLSQLVDAISKRFRAAD